MDVCWLLSSPDVLRLPVAALTLSRILEIQLHRSGDPHTYPALYDAPAEPSVYSHHQGEEAGDTGRRKESHRYCYQE